MLTIPIDRIAVILGRASDVEPADVITGDVAAALESSSDRRTEEEFFGNAPARRALIDALESLTPDEIYELLALSEMAAFDGSAESWNSAVQRAQAIAADDAIDRLVHVLVLSDTVEVGLDRLGYDVPAERKAAADNKKRKNMATSTEKAKLKTTSRTKLKATPKRTHRR
ncbi:MAG: DUF3775 domain-containing protein [Alphaproteobacteria bacterium]|nr:DUF3775 domain-containing protein [Alphaproteobacteria bacterium]